jgi:16S rRNA (guanine1207-N2)-methyltransferase
VTEDHYFTARPASSSERFPIHVTLADQELHLESSPGVFSHDRLDPGTSVLLRHVPPPPPGDLLDLGCGWGAIALTMGLLRPDATVWAVDVNERALDLTRRNAERVSERFPCATVVPALPEAVPEDLTFDAIWSNPPIRVGKTALHNLLAAWLPRLKRGGEAYLVVQRNLGADSLTDWMRTQADDDGQPWGAVERVGSSKGFRVLRLNRA